MTLLLGPLYHLIDPADRAAALTEAVRVTRPGGLVAAAAISRHAALLYDPQGFTNAHFHRAGELAAELEWAGLDGVVVYGSRDQPLLPWTTPPTRTPRRSWTPRSAAPTVGVPTNAALVTSTV